MCLDRSSIIGYLIVLIPGSGMAIEPGVAEDVPAYHWQRTWYPAGVAERFKYEGRVKPWSTEEGWAVRGVGRRVETRQGSKLVSVVVDTPRWRFVWYVSQKLVVAVPSRLDEFNFPPEGVNLVSRRWITAWETRNRATMVWAKDRRNGEEVEKLTARSLGDPDYDGRCPIHGFDPKKHQKLLESPDAQFRTRTYWLDPQTHLQVAYRCGCKSPKQEYSIDYPAPESVPRELFEFQIPRDARLEIDDPQLGRRILSEGQSFPDPRE